ncbi:MAG: tRNA pseudouridine13 synthase [Planctomycetota bacterium]|jgi:tRNA pseudouridine13 synthase
MTIEPDEPAVSTDSLSPIWAPGYRHLTGDVTGVDFKYRVQSEDFEVEEIPLEEPASEGTHSWIWIEKREIGTLEAIRALARALQCDPESFGYAGRKDARAITRQWLSVEHVTLDSIRSLQLPSLRVIGCAKHTKKLRIGALRGNRFSLLLRELRKEDADRMTQVLSRLQSEGLPNYFGAQRFGRDGRTFEAGRMLLAGDSAGYLELLTSEKRNAPEAARTQLGEAIRSGTRGDHRRLKELVPLFSADPDLAAVAQQLARRPFDLEWAVRAIPSSTRKFHLSALQSRIFNRGLAARLTSGERIEPGDRVIEFATMNAGRGGGTPVPLDIGQADLELLRGRARGLEISASGRLPGHKVPLAQGRPAEVEDSALLAEGLTASDFERGAARDRPVGTRRPLFVPAEELSWSFVPGGCQLKFTLPRGSFATTFLEELRKDFAAGGAQG